jgi:hypothetical protein
VTSTYTCCLVSGLRAKSVLGKAHVNALRACDMGLDGGTYITRSDILRGQSWRMANADSTRSTRGGAVGASTTYQKKQLDVQSTRCWSQNKDVALQTSSSMCRQQDAGRKTGCVHSGCCGTAAPLECTGEQGNPRVSKLPRMAILLGARMPLLTL